MHRVSDIVGKPIISAETGDKLGSVTDGLIDNERNQLVGLVIGGGVFGKEHVLPYADVQTIGGDTVLARGGSGVMSGKQWRGEDHGSTRSGTLKGRPVVTTGGQKIGVVGDILIDEGTGRLDCLEIATPDFGGLVTRRSLLPFAGELRIGRDAVVVPDNAAECVQRTVDDDSPRGRSRVAACQTARSCSSARFSAAR